MNMVHPSLCIGGAVLLWSQVASAQFAAPYAVYGSSDLDLTACSQAGPVGTATATFWVRRRYDITGPTQIALENVPADVSVTFSPATLTYPGWVTGQQVTVAFTVNAGVAVPDVVVQLDVTDAATNQVTYQLLLHGTCPRHNRDFTIRGWFESVQLGTSFPVDGALVEIYRDVPWGFDQRVGSTITRPDGSFDVKLWANDEDVYYAKLRLNDVSGVYLHDWWTPDIKDYNSANRGSNSAPVIDLGGTAITKDGGLGTPKSAVWQGGHAAYQETGQTLGVPPPTGDYEIVNQNTVSGMTWTARSTTNYEEGVATYKFSSGTPIGPKAAGFDSYFSQFINYSTNFHEFGHALRHTVDGDQAHFIGDAARWTYARGHSLCGSNAGYIDVEAFGFNEGWAEFWSLDTGNLFLSDCPSVALTDMTKEGAVMNDLHIVAQAIDRCQPPIADRTEAARAQRRNLFSVLNRGSNIIHSEGEFRDNAAQQFPGCVLPPVGLGIASSPLTVTRRVTRLPPAALATRLRQRVEYYHRESRRLSRDLAAATVVAAKARSCRVIPCKTFIARVLRPVVLRGQISYADLIGRSFARRYAELRVGCAREPDMSEAAIDREQARREEFRTAILKIDLQALETSARLLDRYSERDTTGKVRAVADDLRRTARRLQLRAPLNDELFTLLELPAAPDDDRTGPVP